MNARKLIFVVPGEPVVSPRLRLRRTRRGRILLGVNERAQAFQERVREEAIRALEREQLAPLRSCAELVVRSFSEHRGACEVHRAVRPEDMGLMNTVSAALMGVALVREAKVVRAHFERLLAPQGEPSRVLIKLSSLHGEWP
jgi:hypothetical protein